MWYIKNGKLNDERILNDLQKLPYMFENGEISEVKDIIIDIYGALEEWEDKGCRS